MKLLVYWPIYSGQQRRRHFFPVYAMSFPDKHRFTRVLLCHSAADSIRGAKVIELEISMRLKTAFVAGGNCFGIPLQSRPIVVGLKRWKKRENGEKIKANLPPNYCPYFSGPLLQSGGIRQQLHFNPNFDIKTRDPNLWTLFGRGGILLCNAVAAAARK